MAFVCLLLNLYLVVLFGAIILSWFPLEPGTPLASLYRVLWNVTNPVLAPIRSLLPDLRIGAAAIDLSPFVVVILITILQNVIC